MEQPVAPCICGLTPKLKQYGFLWALKVRMECFCGACGPFVTFGIVDDIRSFAVMKWNELRKFKIAPSKSAH